MKPRSVFPRAVALVSLLVAALSVGCGSDEPLGPGAIPDVVVVGILEEINTRGEGFTHTYLLIGDLRYPDLDVHCDSVRREWLRLSHLEWPIIVIEPDGSRRWGGLNDMAIGDTIRARIWGVCTIYCFAKRISVIKPESDL